MIRYCTVCKQPLITEGIQISPIPMYCIECYKKLEEAWKQTDIFEGEDYCE